MWWFSSLAFAGHLYVNGVNVDSLRNQSFEGVTVRVDEHGDVWVTAPRYKIQVVDPVPTATQTGSVTTVTSSQPTPVASITTGRWWLVTEDSGSRGHTVDVYVNGNLVQTVRSGEGQLIRDLAPWLRSGENAVRLRVTGANVGGGPFYVYLGRGSNEGGTVVMDSPQVQLGLTSTQVGEETRNYTLRVD